MNFQWLPATLIAHFQVPTYPSTISTTQPTHSDAVPISCLRVNGPASSPVDWWQIQLVRAVFFVVYLTDVREGVALDLARDVILVELSEGLELLRKLGLEQLVIILPQCIFPLLHNLADN